MTDLTALKQAARSKAQVVRAEAHDAAKGPGLATDHLLEALADAPEGPVAGYLPIRSEIDPVPAMTALAGAGRAVCVPVIEGATALSFARWTPDIPLVPGPFKVRIPAEVIPVRPTALIVPLLAFTRSGHRLGYGGGHYDRTFAKFRAEGPMLAVGVAYAAQEVPELPVEPTDQRLDAVATEAEILRFPLAGGQAGP